VSRYDAVLLDAFGTVIALDSPFRRLRAALHRRLGLDLPPADVRRAFTAEMAYYATHCDEGRDPASLHDLRLRCAGVIRAELRLEHDPEAVLAALADAVRFRVFDDVAPTLGRLAEAGVAVGVVSNWDCSLPESLAEAGLRFDAVVDSASSGSAKPDPAIFRRALRDLGVEPARALHVGDTDESDGIGAIAAGIDVRIIDRAGRSPGRDRIGSLTDILPLVV
jgi:HAD superfamily hydrolase (TIGR01549 family)